MEVSNETDLHAIDKALTPWRQGDCVLGEHWFLFRIALNAPITEEAAQAAVEGVDAGEADVRGFMVATQTCDIIRSCADRHFVEVCPLEEVDANKLDEIQRGRRPNYAFISGVAENALVADLDRVMTVEKAVLASWDRVQGCHDDDEVRRLAMALARKRSRFAFPDDFVKLASKLQDRMSSKHSKESDEGRALRALREIRVRATPSWDADHIEITLLFIPNKDEPNFDKQGWAQYLEAWLDRVPESGRFETIVGLIQTLDDLTARDYVESDPLDLDHLSRPATP